LIPDGIDMSKESAKSLYCVFKDQPPQKRLSRGGTCKCMVLVFANIDAYDRVLIRSTDLILHLTILLEPDKIFSVHYNLLLVLMGFDFWLTLCYQEVIFFSTR
jgi:hypothetical protein